MSSTVDLDALCAGACMSGFRRKVRAHEHAVSVYLAAYADWQRAVEAWHPPLVRPEEPVRPEDPRLPYPVHGDPVYCPSCVYELKAMLSKLDGAACVYLRESDGLRGQTDQVRVSGSAEEHSLSPTIEDLDEFDSWLRSWKSAYLGIDTFARAGHLADSITLGTAWLVARAERLLTRPEIALDFGQEIRHWYGKLAVHDPSEMAAKPRRTSKPLRCPQCHLATLSQLDGEDRIECRNRDCGEGRGGPAVLTTEEYEALLDSALTAARSR
ncbi:hypothetical protein [Nonomuraea typhae]|uniref:hypothetical protein n=1 Tax=Nonomuraea typhae TaxID=2603600 RepID=UPI0012FC9EF9|nr:hypothetical protein [Nonomuraea typhae]